MSQTINGVTTNYVLDQAGVLTQVLSDGTSAYLYGDGRIGEEQPGGWQYHLGDALGSVRQLVDADANVTLSRAYEPFGDPLLTAGAGTSIYTFAGEQRDATGLVYLRARYYGPTFGRFLSRDVWEGDPNQPMSYNAWLYVYADPLNAMDPSGMCPDEDLDGRCDPWWVHCRMISDPELNEQCVECHTPTATRSEVFIQLPSAEPSGRCLQFIAGWEGCRLNLYDDIPERCPDRGNCTIGLGHLVHRGCCDGREEGRPFAGGITENEAWAWLRTDVETAARDVRTAVQVPLTQHQFDALVSLAYNIGGPRFAESDLLFRLNDGDYASVPDELMVFVYQPGHLRRRQQEGWMFVSSVYMLNPIFCR